MATVDLFGTPIEDVGLGEDELEELRRRTAGGASGLPSGGELSLPPPPIMESPRPDVQPTTQVRPPNAPILPGGLEEAFARDVQAGWRDPADLPMAHLVDRDRGHWENALRAFAAEIPGAKYQGEADDIARNLTYARNMGMDPAVFLEQAKRKIAAGASNTPGGGDPYAALSRPSGVAPATATAIGQFMRANPGDWGRAASALGVPASAVEAYRTGLGSGWNTTQGFDFNTTLPAASSLIPNLFNDPATTQLEERIRAQLAMLQAPITDPARAALVAQLQQMQQTAQAGNPQLQQLLQAELDRLRQPVVDPQRDSYMARLQAEMDRLGSGVQDPEVDAYRAQLQAERARLSGGVIDPDREAYRAQLREALWQAQNNPQLARVMALIDAQLGETPGYSAAELAVLNTQAFEPIEALREAGQRRALERASARGILPSSGLVGHEQGEVDRQADTLRMQAHRDTAIQAIAERNADLARQIQLGQLAVSLPQEQQRAALGYGSQLADVSRAARAEEEARSAQALGYGSQLADLSTRLRAEAEARSAQALGYGSQLAQLSERGRAEAEARQAAARGIGTALYQDLPAYHETRGLNAASALAQLSQAARSEEQGRQARALDLSSLLYQLPRTALQDALAVAQGSHPSAAASPFLSLLQQQQQQQMFEQQQRAALWANLGTIFSELFR